MNKMKLRFESRLENEAFARTSVVAFLMPLNLKMEELMEIKTMLAEAVVNAMIHGYEQTIGEIEVALSYDEEHIELNVHDDGCGIDDVDKAMEPLYTSKANLERSGMGLTIMQSFADDFTITSEKGKGCTIHIVKQIVHEHDTNE